MIFASSRHWINRLLPARRSLARQEVRRRGRPQHLRLEILEDRTLLSAVTHLAFDQQPSDVVVGQPIAPAVTVLALDEFNQVVTTGSPNISVALGTNPPGAALGGTTTVTGQNGVVAYSDLSVDQTGTGFTLTAGLASLPLPALGVVFVENGATLPELEVQSYSWGANASPRYLNDFRLTLAPTSVEPGLWGHLAAGRAFSSAVIHLRDAGGLEYQTYTLSNVTIASFSTGGSAGSAPADTIALHFGAVTERATPPAGTANTAQYNVSTNTSGGVGSLAGPALPQPPQLGVVFVENGVTLPELEVQSYSWFVVANPPVVGGSGAGASPPRLSDFRLTLAPTSVEPGLWGHLVAGRTLVSTVVHLRDASGREYQTYTLSNVTISSFSTGGSQGIAPATTITLHFGSMTENATPPAGPVNTAQYNVATNVFGGVGSLAASALPQPPQLGVTFVENGVTLPELEVQSYSWGASASAAVVGGAGAGTGRPTLSDFKLTLAPTSVEPGLWGRLAAGRTLTTAVIHLRDASGREYQTYNLSKVTIISFETGGSAGSAPANTIYLQFGAVTGSATPPAGPANTAQYNLSSNTFGGVGSLAASALPEPPQLGVTFVENGVTLPELEVQSYSWGVSSNSAVVGGAGASTGRPILFDFTLTLAPTSVQPGLWGRLAAGRTLDSAVVHLRDASGREYQSYSLSNVNITYFSTDGTAGSAPAATIALRFAAVTERATPLAGPANTAQYSLATNTIGGSLAGPALSPPPQLGVVFVENGVTLPELEVLSYSWGGKAAVATVGGAGASTSRSSLNDFLLTLAPSSVEPGLWSHLAGVRTLTTALIHLRDASGREYQTYTLSNATISYFSTDGNAGSAPAATIALHFGAVTESAQPPAGPVNTAQYNVSTNSFGVVGSLAAPTLPQPPQLGVVFVENGVTMPELEVLSYSWGASAPLNGGAGGPSLQDFTLTLAPTSVEPALWSRLAVGRTFATALIRLHDASGRVYLTYTLSNVNFTTFSTTATTGLAPLAVLGLRFTQVREDFRPLNPDGSLGAANTAQFNRSTNLSGGAGSLAGPAPQTSTISNPFNVLRSSITTLDSSANSSALGDLVTFTATVSDDQGLDTPTGVVQFQVDGVNSGDPVALSDGTASFDIAPLPGGLRTITALYSGDSDFGPSGGSFELTVNPVDTSVTVVSSGTLSVQGQSVTFTATVSAVSAVPIPVDGLVQFQVEGSDVGDPVAVVDGSASFSTTDLTLGTDRITASFLGSESFNPSIGTAPDQTVTLAFDPDLPDPSQNLQDAIAAQLQADPAATTFTFAAPTYEAAVIVVSAINVFPAQALPITLVVNLGPGVFTDLVGSPPLGVTLAVNGDEIMTVMVGESPAWTQPSGDVLVSGVTLTTATDAPTIVFSSGSLTLQNVTVNESTGFKSAAIDILGGSVHFGSGVTLKVNGPGQFIHNTGPNPVSALGVALVVDGVLLTDNLDPIGADVATLYRVVLGRVPDPGGFSNWVHALQSGASRQKVARGFWESAEHRGIQVDGFYATILHRAAESAGRAVWVNALLAGMREEIVERLILTSPEYLAAHSDTLSYIQGVYHDVLGRAADPTGIALGRALDPIASGRAILADVVLNSAEAHRRIVDGFYAQFLNRGPDAVGERAWLSALQNPTVTQNTIAEGFLASDEFFAHAVSL